MGGDGKEKSCYRISFITKGGSGAKSNSGVSRDATLPTSSHTSPKQLGNSEMLAGGRGRRKVVMSGAPLWKIKK